jgi:hypothetical protein
MQLSGESDYESTIDAADRMDSLNMVCITTALPNPRGICDRELRLGIGHQSNTHDTKPRLNRTRALLHHGEENRGDEGEEPKRDVDHLIPSSAMHDPSRNERTQRHRYAVRQEVQS